MSRSYRHTVGIVKQQNTKGMKKMANKHVRRHVMELPNKGKAYKKLFETWDICDYRWSWTKEDAIAEWYKYKSNAENGINPYYRHYNSWFMKQYPTLEEYLKYWEKCVKRK